MAYKKVLEATAETAFALGGKDGRGKANPTSVEGYYLGSKKVDSDYGESKLHIFNTAEGNVGVWGKTNLDRLLTDARLGQMCLVNFIGMGKAQKGKRPPYQYEVQYDDANTIRLDNIDLNASTGEEPNYASSSDDVEDDVDQVDPTEDEKAIDEVVPRRASAPSRPLTPNAAAVSRTQALLGSRNKIS